MSPRHHLVNSGQTLLAAALALACSLAAASAVPVRLVPLSPLVKVLGSAPPPATNGTALRLEGARGETVSGQVVLWTQEFTDTFQASMTDLRLTNPPAVLPASAFRLQWVRYLTVSTNTTDIPADELIGRAPLEVPDAFWEAPARAIEPRQPQPLWVEVVIPTNAAPGVYRGELAVAGLSHRSTLPVRVRVRNFDLPAERHQRVIQWWDFPGRTFEGLQPGTDAYWRHLERFCALVHEHRQTDVWVSWGLITPQPATNGAPPWNTALFERYCETVFQSGLRAVQFGAAGRHTKFQLDPTSRTEAVEDNLGRLAAANAVVRRRGWQGRVLTALADEPFIYHEATYMEALRRVRQAAPDIPVIEAVETDQIRGLDIYVPKLTHINLWWPQFEQLQREGRGVWFYTCCHPRGRYPNRYLDQPLVKARALHWIGYRYHLDGFLHWGCNWFKAEGDPYSEAGRNPWNLPPGDSQVAYPGAQGWLGSMRFSALRDGLQDYERLRLLEQKLAALRQRLGDEAAWLDPRQRPLELCRRVAASFHEHTRDPQVLLDTRAAVADEIEALEDPLLLMVQTSPPEGTVTPAGPVLINVRGVVTPGAKVTLNGRELLADNLRTNGCFADLWHSDRGVPELVITAERAGQTRTLRRTFRVEE